MYDDIITKSKEETIVDRIRNISEYHIKNAQKFLGDNDYIQPEKQNQIKCIGHLLENNIYIDVITMPIILLKNGKSLRVCSIGVESGFTFEEYIKKENPKSMFIYSWIKNNNIPVSENFELNKIIGYSNNEMIRFAPYHEKIKVTDTLGSLSNGIICKWYQK